MFLFPFDEIKENDYGLSISNYKEIEYEEVEYEELEIIKKKFRRIFRTYQRQELKSILEREH